MASTITINRAPVLTVWAAVVSQRLGLRWDESLSLGRALAGLNAQSKGRRLGIFKPSEARKADHGEPKFGDRLDDVRAAMMRLAKAYRPTELAKEAFRPPVPEGTKGWGAKGVLDLRKIEAMGRRR